MVATPWLLPEAAPASQKTLEGLVKVWTLAYTS